LVDQGLLTEEEALRLDLDPNSEKTLDKAVATSIKRTLLRGLSQNPKSTLIKAALASHYIKYEDNFLLANNLIEELQRTSPSIPVNITVFMIRMDV